MFSVFPFPIELFHVKKEANFVHVVFIFQGQVGEMSTWRDTFYTFELWARLPLLVVNTENALFRTVE